jgi:hypothetical protein
LKHSELDLALLLHVNKSCYDRFCSKRWGVKVKGVFLLESWTLSCICRANVYIKLLIIREMESRYLLKTRVKYFMDTALVYSRMHLIRNLKHLWFITKPKVSIPSPSVPHNSSKISLLIWSAPTKHRIKFPILIVIFISI